MTFIQLLLRLVARLPLRFWQALGALAGLSVFRMNARYAARLKENFLGSGLAGEAGQQHLAVLECAQQIGMGGSEVLPLWFRPYQDALKLVTECTGWEHVEAAVQAGKGLLVITPHLGCFEIVSLYYAAHYPITALYKPPRQSWAETLMCVGRTKGLASLATTDRKGVRILLSALKRGEAVGILPDQVASTGDGVWTNFFGRPAYTPTLPARLVSSTGAVPLIFFGERLPKGQGYRIHISPLPQALSTDKAAATRELNTAIENLIRRYPTQYLWSYNRYKHPGGAPSPDIL